MIILKYLFCAYLGIWMATHGFYPFDSTTWKSWWAVFIPLSIVLWD